MHEYLIVSDSLQPHGLQPANLLCPWDSSSKNTGVGCHLLLLRGNLPNPGIKPMSPTSPTLQADSLLLSHQGSPLELPYDPAIPLVGIYLKEMKSLS